MNKIQYNNIHEINGGGKVCDYISGGLSGWGIGGLIVGGIAASTGVGFVLGAAAIGLYCAGEHAA